MSTFFLTYMTAWGAACLVAVMLMVRYRATLDLFGKTYWIGLFQGWKIATFLIATIGLVVIAPYTGDPTWDYVDATFMSVLTYATAPWVVGTLFLSLKRKRPLPHTYIAVCTWMFSASWSYDLYLVIRDGYYPHTWLPNIFASSVLYFSGGLFWSLENVAGRGVIFGYMHPGWPFVPKTGAFTRIMWYALPFMLLVSAMIIPFLL